MQEKIQNISPIKQRILQFIDTLSISKRDFYAKTGISRGTLESKTGITEDTLAKFIATYSDISINWLIIGKGSMIIDERADHEKNIETDENKQNSSNDNSNVIIELLNQLDKKDTQIELLNREIINLIKENSKRIISKESELYELNKEFCELLKENMILKDKIAGLIQSIQIMKKTDVAQDAHIGRSVAE